MARYLLIIITVIGTCFPAYASRLTKSHSLSECIEEAGIIVGGIVWPIDDAGELDGLKLVLFAKQPLKGVLKVKDLRTLGQPEGTPVEKDMLMCIPIDCALNTSPLGDDGHIEIHPYKPYIFFLKNKPNERGYFELFDSADGVIHSSQPIWLEISKQLKNSEMIAASRENHPKPERIELSGKLVRPMKASPYLNLGLSGSMQRFHVRGELLGNIKEGTFIRVKGIVRSHYHKGGTASDRSPFPAQWMIWLDVTELKTLK